MKDGWHLTKGNREEEHSRRRAQPEQRPDMDKDRPSLKHNNEFRLAAAWDTARESWEESLQL